MKGYTSNCRGNWGDNFSRYLLKHHCGLDIEWEELVSGKKPEAGPDSVFAAGSILEYVPDGYEGHILGTGLMYAESRVDLSKAKVHLLRGVDTHIRSFGDITSPSGDLGLLAYLFAPPPGLQKIHKRGIIPHYVDRDIVTPDDDTIIIDIQSGILPVLALADRCEAIVSSSLHGLILADSLGIPNKWVRLSDRVAGGDFKFNDYYSGYGEFQTPATSVEQGFSEVLTRDVETAKKEVKDACDRFVSMVRPG